MRFLADESCDFAIVRALRAAGHDVIAVAELSGGVPDHEVMELARADSRVRVTEDKDFDQLVFSALAGSEGVILIRYPAAGRDRLPSAWRGDAGTGRSSKKSVASRQASRRARPS